MAANNRIVKKVEEVYLWLEEQIKDKISCEMCGKCCNFKEYDHRLFITSPEMIYLKAKLGRDIRAMAGGVCPYNVDGKCEIHENRFTGCRIFYCKGDVNFQSRLSESAMEKFKSICTEFHVPYLYTDLADALNNFAAN